MGSSKPEGCGAARAIEPECWIPERGPKAEVQLGPSRPEADNNYQKARGVIQTRRLRCSWGRVGRRMTTTGGLNGYGVGQAHGCGAARIV